MKKYIKYVVLLFVILFLVFGPFKQHLNAESLNSLVDKISESKYAIPLFILLYIVSVVFAIPGSALTITAGVIFGFVPGVLIVTVAANIGCNLTFLISRYFGKDFLPKMKNSEGFISSASSKIEKNGFLYILYIRLIPIFPFSIINYLVGLTPLKYKDYVVGSLLGMLPGTILYVYLASSAKNIKDNPLAFILAIILIIIFTVVITLVKKHIEKREVLTK